MLCSFPVFVMHLFHANRLDGGLGSGNGCDTGLTRMCKVGIPLRIHCETLGLDSLEVYLLDRGSASKWPSKKSTW